MQYYAAEKGMHFRLLTCIIFYSCSECLMFASVSFIKELYIIT